MKPKTVRELRARSAPQPKPSGRVAPLAGTVPERKHAEEVLRLFRAAMDVSADMIMLVDRATMRYIDVNATACEMHGYTREAMLRMGPQDVAPFSNEALERAYDETIASGTTTRQESYHHRKDGTRFPVEICRRAVREGKGWIIVSIVRDISERTRAELLQNLEHAVARALAEAESASAVMTAVISAICKTDGWECGRYFSVDEGAGVLRFSEGWGAPDPAIEQFLEDSRNIAYERGSGLAGGVWQSGAPLWTNDVASDPRARRAGVTRELGIRSVFVFPVISEGKTIGVLAFSSRRVREPDERLLRAAHAIGSQIGQFLRRKQAEESLRAKENRFRRLTELTSDVYWEQDDQYRFTSFSDTGPDSIKALNYRRLGRKRWEQNYLNLSAADWAAHIAVLDARRPFHELELCRLNEAGEKIWIRVSGEPVFDASGAFKGYHGVGQDITARKREERLLMLEHAVARCLTEADSASAGMKTVIRAVCVSEGWECGRYWRVDEAAGVLRFSESWNVPDAAIERFIMEKREAVVGPGVGLAGRAWQSGEPAWVTDIVNDAGALRAAVTLETGLRGAFHFPVKADGRTIGVIAFNSRKIRDPDERLLQAVRVIGSQIGQFLQRKQAEEVLRESEARFRATFDSAPVGIMHTSIDYDDILHANPKLCEMLGYTRDELLAMRTDDVVHPEYVGKDRPKYRERLLRGEVDDFSSERHYVRKDGSSLWVNRTVSLARDAAGRPLYFIRIVEDITERTLSARRREMEHAVTQVLAESATAEEAMPIILRTICQALEWTCGAYWKWHETEELLRCAETWHIDAEGVAEFVAATRESPNEAPAWHGAAPGTPTGGVVRRVWFSGAPAWFADVMQQPGFRRGPVATRAGLHSAFGFPILAGRQPWGVMEFYSRDIKQPDEPLLQMVRAIGSQIGQYLRRKQSEETVRDYALQQRLMAEFGRQAFASADLEDVLNRAVRLVSGALKVEYANVLELDPSGTRLTHRAAVGWPREWLGQRVVEIEPGSRLDHVLSRSEPVVVDDFNAETRLPASPLAQLGIRSGVRVPILGARTAYGILSVHEQKPRHFTDEEVSFLQSVASILAIAIERKSVEDKMAHLAQFDTVTGLPNRYLFLDRLGQMLTQAQRNEWLVGTLFVDLDRFKAVNDTYGHDVGDKLLRQAAARLKECVRGGDTVGRLSGDEFAVVLSNLAKADDAGLVAQKIVSALAAPFDLDGRQAFISASIGIALYPADGADPESLIKNADTAMYRVKQHRRNGYQFYLPEMNERLMQRMQLEAQLRGALERREFLLHYQPKVNLDSGAITGLEALLRWRHGELTVSPAEFIPILEETGLIVPVGEWVLNSACEQIRQWQQQGVGAQSVAVNLSARQFQRENLPAVVGRVLAETGIRPELLELELTESLLMSDAEEAVEMLHQLKSLGVRLTVDDFGTGYSSLAYLKRFPLDALKIDRTFISDATSDPDDTVITLTIISLAHNLKLKVVAEGVETEAQLNFLRSHGCDEMQGFYFARPMPAEDCTRMLIEGRRLEHPPGRLRAEVREADQQQR